LILKTEFTQQSGAIDGKWLQEIWQPLAGVFLAAAWSQSQDVDQDDCAHQRGHLDLLRNLHPGRRRGV